MAGASRTYRTALEISIISIVIHILLGTPGLELFTRDTSSSLPRSPAKVDNLVYPRKDLHCPRHSYTTHIFATSPLVIYIDNFLSDEEADHLVALSAHKWNPSTTVNAGIVTLDPTVRKSEKAAIPRDRTVQCIEARALAFQGWPRDTFIERLWTQRYNVSGHYAPHFDWAASTRSSRRVSSFMVYLRDECEGGGTRFPRLANPAGEWCAVVECEGDGGEGTTFKARKGGAVFWRNFDEEGRGYKETVHAGMPVVAGQKIGLNIWSWYQAGHQVPSEEEEEEEVVVLVEGG